MDTPAATHPPSGFGQHIWVAGLLGNIHDAGIAIATCVAGLEQEDFFASCLTMKTAMRALLVMQKSIVQLPLTARQEITGIDWTAWEEIEGSIPPLSKSQEDTVWHVIRVLLPSFLVSLNRTRRYRPHLFQPFGAGKWAS